MTALAEMHARLSDLCAAGAYEEALPLAEKLTAGHPSEPVFWFLLGCIRVERAALAGAEAAFNQACALNPTDAGALYNLGVVQLRQSKPQAAVHVLEKACRLDPENLDCLSNFAAALRGVGRLSEATQLLREAVRRAPRRAAGVLNLADALLDQGALEEALPLAQALVEAHPDNTAARAMLFNIKAAAADLSRFEDAHGISTTFSATEPPTPPFALLHMEDAPARQKLRSAHWAKKFAPASPATFTEPTRSKIRIGYFSGTFHDHPMLYLTGGLFREHDRTSFDVFAYSLGSPRTSDIAAAVRPCFRRFRDVYALSDSEIAAQARQDRLDIAIDLDGPTKGARLGVFAAGAAPVQISYLGYPGTIAAPFFDYIVADAVVIPPHLRPHYTENILFLPHSYQPVDSARAQSRQSTTRADHGLSEAACVLGCFNTPMKLGAEEFNIWMRVMRKVPRAVLWLLEAHPLATQNLRGAAQACGIDPERLIFAPRVAQRPHIERLRHADLMVDTFFYNGHTTTSDALWAGVPVLTKAGEQMAARVATSILTAANMPQLVTATAEDYEARLLRLLEAPSALADLKSQVAQHRQTAPFFDTQLYTRDFEAGLREIHQVSRGGPLRDIIVKSGRTGPEAG
ncbi:MAG: tetratricopeptide repeat protein [Pseudomonadota bacterium]